MNITQSDPSFDSLFASLESELSFPVWYLFLLNLRYSNFSLCFASPICTIMISFT